MGPGEVEDRLESGTQEKKVKQGARQGETPEIRIEEGTQPSSWQHVVRCWVSSSLKEREKVKKLKGQGIERIIYINTEITKI